MDLLQNQINVQELFDPAARVTTVGTYGSKVIDRIDYGACVAVLNSAASSAGTSVTLDVVVQEADAAAANSIFDRSDGDEDTDVELRKDSNDNIKLAVQFTTVAACTISSVFLRLKKAGTITSGKIVTCRIETDSSDDPTGTLVHADATKDVETDDIDSAYSWVEFAFDRPVDLAAATAYHIVLTGDYTESDTNCVKMATSTVASGGTFNIFDSAWGGISATDAGVGYIFTYTFADISGAEFTTVDETAASFEEVEIDLRPQKRYIRAKATVAGSSASFICGASVVLGNAKTVPV